MKHRLTPLFLILICLFGLWLRFPFIGEGLPYFQREDEGHHFNRIADMVKSGDLDPHYFHKPSLHFYLRIPVLAASFIWSVREGHIRSVKEIVTRDPYGLAGYSFSASHPGLVKANRTFSVALSVLILLLVFLITRQLTPKAPPALLAAFLAAASPSLVKESAVVGVDVVMAFFCLLTIYATLRLERQFSTGLLAWTGLCAGLAVSSKYNALPIALLPLLCCLLNRRWSIAALALAVVMPAAGFLLGTPYLIVNLPTFLDQLAYEVWHYGVAGHVGHESQPGVAQALFYLNWLIKEALGPVTAAFGLVGAALLLLKDWKGRLLFLFFPVLFALQMVGQRANFTRNMLVFVPCVTIAAAVVLGMLFDYSGLKDKTRAWLAAAFAVIAGFYPLSLALSSRSAAAGFVDNRVSAASWLQENKLGPGSATAISGQLQFVPALFAAPGVSRLSQSEMNPLALYLAGYDRIVSTPKLVTDELGRKLLQPEKNFPGAAEQDRVLVNPGVRIARLSLPAEAEPEVKRLITGRNQYVLDYKLADRRPPAQEIGCSYADERARSATENYCWVSARLTFLRIKGLESPAVRSDAEGNLKLLLELQTPWADQKIRWSLPDWELTTEIEPGEFQDITLKVPLTALRQTGGLYLHVPYVLSPLAQGVSVDPRRLGVAIRSVRAAD